MDDSDNVPFHVMERVQSNDHTNPHNDYHENSTPPNRDNKGHNEKNLVCFWMMGFFAAIGGTILSSASFDVIKRLETSV